MPNLTIDLSPEMDRFVNAKVQSGEYASANEVLNAGLRALEEREREDQSKLEALREAIRAGDESGIAEGDVIEEVRERIRRRALATGGV